MHSRAAEQLRGKPHDPRRQVEPISLSSTNQSLFYGLDFETNWGADKWLSFRDECKRPAPPPELPDDGRIWEPLSVDEIRFQRDRFTWLHTQHLSETTVRTYEVDGAQVPLPPMHYVQVYVRSPDHLRELEEMGVHSELTPLFGSEWPADDGSLTMPFEGDPEDEGGQFAFTLMPAQVYNAIRDEALAGEDTYRAMILRQVPEEARGPNNTVSWDYLFANMTQYAPARTEFTEQGEVVPPLLEDDATTADQKRLGRRLRRWVRKVRDVVRVVVDGVRTVIGKVTLLVTRDRTITIVTHVASRNNLPMTRACQSESHAYGDELKLRGLKVNVTGITHLTQYGGTLNDKGELTVTVPRSLNLHVCFEADSPAAKFESGILRPVLHCWNRFRPGDAPDRVEHNVGDTEFYMMAQLIDARDFANDVLGFKPPHVTVQVGKLANALSGGPGGDPYTPCLAAPRAPVSLVNAYVTGANALIPYAGTILEALASTDIVMPENSRKSRVVPVHEYGHFFFCTLLADERMETFNRVWSQVIAFKNLSNDSSTEVKAINEGFADWFVSRVVGGVVYPALYQAGREGVGVSKLFDTADPALGLALEENVGGPSCVVPPFMKDLKVLSPDLDSSANAPGCQVSNNQTKTAQVIATVATLLHDVVDDSNECSSEFCSPFSFNDGAHWTTSAAPFGREARFTGTSVPDENVSMAPLFVTQAIRDFASSNGFVGQKLSYDEFYKALGNKMVANLNSSAEVCNLFSLHAQSGQCTARGSVSVPTERFTVRGVVSATTGGGTVVGVPFGSTTCSAGDCTVDDRKTAILKAVADPGFVFNSWTCSAPVGRRLGTNPAALILFDVARDVTCEASFNKLPTATVTIVPTPGGTVSISSATGTCNATSCAVLLGGGVDLFATADATHVFLGWSGCATGSLNPIRLSNVRNNASCSATFVGKQVTVTAAADTGGSVSPGSSTINLGSSVTLRATVTDSRYRFVGWWGSPGCSGTSPTLSVTPTTGNVSCRATFARIYKVTFTSDSLLASVSAKVDATGQACPASGCTVDGGGSVTLTGTATELGPSGEPRCAGVSSS